MAEDDEIIMSLENAMTSNDIDSDDHEMKNDRTQEELEKANLKMSMKNVGASNEDSDNEPPQYVTKDGKKMHYRTEEDYSNIWEAFITNAEQEFKEYMGYGREVIERIGVKKFIDMYDWRDGSDVFSWKTDTLHIIPCVHCNDEFVTFEQDIGLCNKCAQLYDMDMFTRLVNEVQGDDSVKDSVSPTHIALKCLSEFVYDDEFRSKFLKTELDKRDAMKQEQDILKNKWTKQWQN